MNRLGEKPPSSSSDQQERVRWGLLPHPANRTAATGSRRGNQRSCHRVRAPVNDYVAATAAEHRYGGVHPKHTYPPHISTTDVLIKIPIKDVNL